MDILTSLLSTFAPQGAVSDGTSAQLLGGPSAPEIGEAAPLFADALKLAEANLQQASASNPVAGETASPNELLQADATASEANTEMELANGRELEIAKRITDTSAPLSSVLEPEEQELAEFDSHSFSDAHLESTLPNTASNLVFQNAMLPIVATKKSDVPSTNSANDSSPVLQRSAPIVDQPVAHTTLLMQANSTGNNQHETETAAQQNSEPTEIASPGITIASANHVEEPINDATARLLENQNATSNSSENSTADSLAPNIPTADQSTSDRVMQGVDGSDSAEQVPMSATQSESVSQAPSTDRNPQAENVDQTEQVKQDRAESIEIRRTFVPTESIDAQTVNETENRSTNRVAEQAASPIQNSRPVSTNPDSENVAEFATSFGDTEKTSVVSANSATTDSPITVENVAAQIQQPVANRKPLQMLNRVGATALDQSPPTQVESSESSQEAPVVSSPDDVDLSEQTEIRIDQQGASQQVQNASATRIQSSGNSNRSEIDRNETEAEAEASTAKSDLQAKNDDSSLQIESAFETAPLSRSIAQPNAQSASQPKKSVDKSILETSPDQQAAIVSDSTSNTHSESRVARDSANAYFETPLTNSAERAAPQASPAASSASVPEQLLASIEDYMEADSLSSVAQNETVELRMKLNPENLGEVVLLLNQSADAKTASILVGDEMVQKLIENGMEHVEQSLKELGFNSIDVDIMSRESNERSAFDRQPQQSAADHRDERNKNQSNQNSPADSQNTENDLRRASDAQQGVNIVA